MIRETYFPAVAGLVVVVLAVGSCEERPVFDAFATGKLARGRTPKVRASIRPARSEVSSGFRHGSQASAFHPRRLTYSLVENLALIAPKLIPLADLSAFSVQLLLWRRTEREQILRLNLRIKREAFSQHYKHESRFHPLSSEALDRFVNAGWDSLEAPDLLRIRITEDGIQAKAPEREQIWAVNHQNELPVIIANDLDVDSEVILSPEGAPQPPAPLQLRAGQRSGYFLGLTLGKTGQILQRISIAAAQQQTIVTIPVAVNDAVKLRVKLLDERGEATAARIYLVDANGVARAPKDAFLRVVGGDYEQPFAGDAYFYADGGFETTVPNGPTTLEVLKGFEYEPMHQQVHPQSLAGGESVTVTLKRSVNMAELGWYSGETHIHANIVNNEMIKPEDVWLQVRGEGLNIANLLVSNSVQGAVHDRSYFQGHPHPLSDNGHLMFWAEEMRNAFQFGHMGFLNLRKIVEPLFTGFVGTQWSADAPANYFQAVKAKRQGAVVTQVHPSPDGHEEYPVDLALGVMDAIDVMCQGDESAIAATWYKLLNCGIRCSISAGTDSFLNVMYNLVPGANRVYVKSGPGLDYQSWFDGYKRGNSFATNGPLLFLKVNGKDPGEELRLSQGQAGVSVEATAFSHVPLDNLEVVVNGQTVASTSGTGDLKQLRFSGTVPLSESSWIAVRANGPGHRLAPNDRRIFAHTSPVYCVVGNRPIASRHDAKFFIEWIDELVESVEKQGRFETQQQLDDMTKIFQRGRRFYENIVSASR